MTDKKKIASAIKLQDECFIATKEYRRFAEFCDACKKSQYIGLCYGSPGVGKTKSARHYTNSDFRDFFIEHCRSELIAPPEVRQYDTVFYTPPVVHSPRDLVKGVASLRKWLSILIMDTYDNCEEMLNANLPKDSTKLMIVDECDRLSSQGFEYFRSIYDDENISVIFMGMPGLEKRLARYSQLYSRVGFAHEFKVLSLSEIQFIIETKWAEFGTSFDATDFTDAETLAALVRITNGNFRLLHRLLMQADRIMQINKLTVVTKEVIEAAREILIIGTE